MTQRDQFVGAFGGLDAGEAGGAEDVALLGIALAHKCERLWLHHDTTFGDRDAFGRGLCRHIHHARLAVRAQMGQLCRPARHGAQRAAPSLSLPRKRGRVGWGLRANSARVAAATSSCRIRLSPTRNVAMPALASRARSLGKKMPLSPTTTRPAGMSRASRSHVA